MFSKSNWSMTVHFLANILFVKNFLFTNKALPYSAHFHLVKTNSLHKKWAKSLDNRLSRDKIIILLNELELKVVLLTKCYYSRKNFFLFFFGQSVSIEFHCMIREVQLRSENNIWSLGNIFLQVKKTEKELLSGT